MTGNSSVLDRISPDMLARVPSYWAGLPPMDTVYYKFLFVYTIISLVISCCGNGVVLLIFSRTKSLRTPSNLFVLNLAVSDFSMLATASPMVIINLSNETWVIGSLWCDIYATLGSLFGCVSIWTMSMIAVDRYNVIVRNISKSPMSEKNAYKKIRWIWLWSMLWTAAPMCGWSRNVAEGSLTGCSMDYFSHDWSCTSYLFMYTFFVYYMPLFVICFSYYFILNAVKIHEKAMRAQAVKLNKRSLRSSSDHEKQIEIKLARVALMTIFMWFVSWTPYQIIAFSGYYGLPMTPFQASFGAIFAKSGSCFNPIIYALSHPKYQRALRKRCPCAQCNHDEDFSSQSSQCSDNVQTVVP